MHASPPPSRPPPMAQWIHEAREQTVGPLNRRFARARPMPVEARGGGGVRGGSRPMPAGPGVRRGAQCPRADEGRRPPVAPASDQQVPVSAPRRRRKGAPDMRRPSTASTRRRETQPHLLVRVGHTLGVLGRILHKTRSRRRFCRTRSRSATSSHAESLGFGYLPATATSRQAPTPLPRLIICPPVARRIKTITKKKQ